MAEVVFHVEGDSIFALGNSFGLAEDADYCCAADDWAVAHFDYVVERDAPIVEALGFVDIEDVARGEECGCAADCEVDGEAHGRDAEDAERFAALAADCLEGGRGEGDDCRQKDENEEKIENGHGMLSDVEYFTLQSTLMQARFAIALQ